MERQEQVRRLPAVHELVKAAIRDEDGYPPHILTAAAREVLAYWRQAILEKGTASPGMESLADAVRRGAAKKTSMSLRPVINATGVVLHTNLGRAPLGAAALRAVEEVGRGYCNLELDLKTGERGSRYAHVEDLLITLTGAEAALVVNNNAAAVLLSLHALARGREVIVSRGELVEIGGSFRVPEVMAQSGAILREVGTTNKTYPQDYERAISPETAILLKVHPSNYRIVGFVRDVKPQELVSLGEKHQVPVMEDLGSGVLVDLHQYGLGVEPTVQDSIRAGVDLVTFSGDKLLGGPQAGVIVGRTSLIQVLKESPLLRALRVDKLILAALEATLQSYLCREAGETPPVLRMLTVSLDELNSRAETLAVRLSRHLGDDCEVKLQDGFSRVGGGAFPLTELPTRVIELHPLGSVTAATLATCLRRGNPPVMARLQYDGLILDPRTIGAEEEDLLVEAIAAAVQHTKRNIHADGY